MLLLTFDFSSSSNMESLAGGTGNGSSVCWSTGRVIVMFIHIFHKKAKITSSYCYWHHTQNKTCEASINLFENVRLHMQKSVKQKTKTLKCCCMVDVLPEAKPTASMSCERETAPFISIIHCFYITVASSHEQTRKGHNDHSHFSDVLQFER